MPTLTDLEGLLERVRLTEDLELAIVPAQLQPAAQDLLRVVAAAREVNEDMDTAIHWMQTAPIFALGHHTALELIRLGKTQAVVDYIESISGGSTG